MKNKLLLSTSLALMLGTSAALAAPQTDYTLGTVSAHLDLAWTDVSIGGANFDEKYNMDWGATVGLGGRWAAQYEGFTARGKSNYYPGTGISGSGRLQHHELDVLYKLTDSYAYNYSISAFLGWTHDKGKAAGWSTDNEDNWQIGLTGVVDLNDYFKAYARIGVGNDIFNWKVGLSYALTTDWDLDLFYRYYKVSSMSGLPGGDADGKSKGIGLGVTYRFN